MKPLNRFIAIISIAFFGSVTVVSAQSSLNQNLLKLGIDASIGTTTNNSPFGYGLGIDMFARYKASDELTLISSVGYGRLLTKDTSPIPDYDFIPIKAGIKIFPMIEHFYVLGTVGAGFGIRNGSKTALIFGGGTGYESNKGYDLSVRYEGYQQNKKSTTYQPINGQFAIVLTYNFE
jgi:hypothetical protein